MLIAEPHAASARLSRSISFNQPTIWFQLGTVRDIPCVARRSLGWQESLAQLAPLLEPQIPDGAYCAAAATSTAGRARGRRRRSASGARDLGMR